MFHDHDVEMARERLLNSDVDENQKFSNTDDKHNNFTGLTWGLLSRGKIFAKVKSEIREGILYNGPKMRNH